MILKKYLFSYLAFTALIVFTGCGSNLEDVYVANFNTGDTVKILPDNKFIRIYYDPNYKLNSQIFADTGTWKYEGGRISFINWIDRSGTEHTETGKKIVFITDAKKSFFSNEVKLMIDYDKDYYYKKQK